MGVVEAEAAPVRLLWQAVAWCDALDYLDEQAALDREADAAAMSAARRKGWR